MQILRRVSSITWLLCLVLATTALAQSPNSFKPFGSPAFVSYIGGTGSDSVEGTTIDEAGNIWFVGTSDSTDGYLSGVQNTLNGAAGTGGFLVKYNTQWQRQIFERICAATRIEVAPDNTIWVACNPYIYHLDSTASNVISQIFGFNATKKIEWIPAGTNQYDVIILDQNTDSIARLSGASGVTTPVWKTSIGRTLPQSMAIDRNLNMIFVGGDTNTQTGAEPYRSPFLFRYGFDGQRDTTWFWYAWEGPAVRDRCTTITETCPNLPSDPNLQADSYVTGLSWSNGRMYLAGGSDGGNTVMTRHPRNLTQSQVALNGACYSGPCFGYQGAKKTGFFGRARTDYSNLERQSWIIPYLVSSATTINQTYVRNYPVCMCHGVNTSASSRGPNSYGATGIADFVDGGISYVISWGSSAFRAPETPTNGWHFMSGYAKASQAHVSIMDYDFNEIQMASLIQGATDPKDFAFKNGLLIIVGNVLSTDIVKNATYDARGEQYQWALPVSANAAQPAFGGGSRDGFIYARCVRDVDSCGVAISITAPQAAPTPKPAGGSPQSSTTPQPAGGAPAKPGSSNTGPNGSSNNSNDASAKKQMSWIAFLSVAVLAAAFELLM